MVSLLGQWWEFIFTVSFSNIAHRQHGCTMSEVLLVELHFLVQKVNSPS